MFATIGLQNIIDGNGVAVSITGMLIVFFALMVITIFIAILPVVLKLIPETGEEENKTLEPDESIVAVIAAALYEKKYK